jgi:hypothetical protein
MRKCRILGGWLRYIRIFVAVLAWWLEARIVQDNKMEVAQGPTLVSVLSDSPTGKYTWVETKKACPGCEDENEASSLGK